MAEDWTEKYRPKKLSEVIGNPSAVKELEEWALSWKAGIPDKRAVVLIGSPGIGKTSSAIALANDMDWDLVEMNASDQRTAAVVKDIAQRASYFNSIGMDEEYKGGNRKKLIVMDEADNLFGNADRGALPAINDLIKTTKQPVILIVNDFYALSKKSATVKSDTIQITYRRPVARSIAGALKKIAASEGVSADDAALMKIAENSNGDMRAAVRDLEALSHGRKELNKESTEILQERIVKKDMYSVLGKVFRENDPFGAKKTLSDVDIEPRDAMLWIDENLPYEYKEPGDLVRGYEKLSRSDVFLGRVSRRQYFGLWSYASDMMTAGVAVSRHGGKAGYGQFRFPTYMVKMSRTKSMRGIKSSLCLKIACAMHTSTKGVALDILGPLKELARNDEKIRIMLVREMGLEPEELGFLIDAKIDSKIVKETLEKASQMRTNKETETPREEVPIKETYPRDTGIPEQPEKNENNTPITTAKKPGKNLFDF
ncbi:replication factor C large subunit [Candidatus Methanoplasma termitum]|uniref:Replication factor C large subunit n=1 Tax=Candidatus Methanoplasma termitum TaxID=1577791 RepID=A0A0A7LB15_9ARCH|nr:replication factor C large subunit [Candidatus Methanoplasma termitum]AIZ56355.1 replication factor C large subunit [Candidatus Methanoplasma termitum]